MQQKISKLKAPPPKARNLLINFPLLSPDAPPSFVRKLSRSRSSISTACVQVEEAFGERRRTTVVASPSPAVRELNARLGKTVTTISTSSFPSAGIRRRRHRNRRGGTAL
ncbi:hypothetical protein BT69DRAFT_1284176 [Atractiella rhizophila]|nr:hypothetical protein BT69DRAFT_1284176 [Atractiella rhizophila]